MEGIAHAADLSLLRGNGAPGANVVSSSVVLVLSWSVYWCMRPTASDDKTLLKLTRFCDLFRDKIAGIARALSAYLKSVHCSQSEVNSEPFCRHDICQTPLFKIFQTILHFADWVCSQVETILTLFGFLKTVHCSSELIGPELSRQHSREAQVITVSQNNHGKIPNGSGTSHFRGDTLPPSNSSDNSPTFYTSPPISLSGNSTPNSPTQKVDREQKDTDSSGSSSTVRANGSDSAKSQNISFSRQQSDNFVYELVDTEACKSTSQCGVLGQDETNGGSKNEQFVSHTGSIGNTYTYHGSSAVGTIAGNTQGVSAAGAPVGGKNGSSNLGHNTSVSGSLVSVSGGGCNNSARPHQESAPPTKHNGDQDLRPGHGDDGTVQRTSREVQFGYPVQESGMPCSSDIVVTVPAVPRRIGLVFGSDTISSTLRHRLTSDSGDSTLPSSAKSPRATAGTGTTHPTVTAVGQPSVHKLIKPTKGVEETGCILYSSIAAFEEGSFLPLPSREAVERSIGKGGNGTISIVYFKGLEFAVKRTHFRQMEVEIQSSLRHDNILPLQAVMMGEEDPQRPSRFLCYHFMPRMSGDLQSYLTKVGHGALSNLLMQHKEDPTMLQLVVDNTKHILRSILKGLAYLHSSHIVHNDVKPSNFLTATQCGCVSPLTCDHGQRFAVKLSDFDSAMDVTKVWTRHSVLRQLYRNNPTGTPGYRPPEYVLVATRTSDELDAGTLTAADVWAFGCSVLKIFLSHSGPHTQKQMAFLHLWKNGGCPREKEGERAREEVKLGLLERVYPNWPHLWAFVGECMKVSPEDRVKCNKLLEHSFFAS